MCLAAILMCGALGSKGFNQWLLHPSVALHPFCLASAIQPRHVPANLTWYRVMLFLPLYFILLKINRKKRFMLRRQQ